MDLKKINGRPSRNGICFELDDKTVLGTGTSPRMRLFREGAGTSEMPSAEVRATNSETSLDYFVTPPDARYVMTRTRRGRIRVEMFVREMPRSPILSWIFPGKHEDKLYLSLIEGLRCDQ